MKKTFHFIIAGALLAGTACTSTDTTTDSSTVTTAETATTTADAAEGNPVAPGGREPLVEVTDMSDPMFLINNASSGMMEVQLGQMALQKAASPQVKQFAQTMIDHHTKANNELKAVAMPLNVSLPEVLTQLHQDVVTNLNGKNGKDFEEAYMDAMEEAHRRDIAQFERKAANAENSSVKEFATKMLPILRSHLEMADKIEDRVD